MLFAVPLHWLHDPLARCPAHRAHLRRAHRLDRPLTQRRGIHGVVATAVGLGGDHPVVERRGTCWVGRAIATHLPRVPVPGAGSCCVIRVLVRGPHRVEVEVPALRPRRNGHVAGSRTELVAQRTHRRVRTAPRHHVPHPPPTRGRLLAGEQVPPIGERQVVQVRDAAQRLREGPAAATRSAVRASPREPVGMPVLPDPPNATPRRRPRGPVLPIPQPVGVVVPARATAPAVGVAQLHTDRPVRRQHPPPLRREQQQRVDERRRVRLRTDLPVLVRVIRGQVAPQRQERRRGHHEVDRPVRDGSQAVAHVSDDVGG